MTNVDKTLLIIDDALIVRQKIRDIAESVGWRVVGEGANGTEAVHLFEQTRPALVTLDIIMPEMDRVTALRQILKLDPAAQVVMISAVDQRQKLSECVEVGAIDFIVKPFDSDELRQFLARQLDDPSSGAPAT